MRENDTNSKKSSRAILIVVAAVLLVAGGATYWFVQSSANKTCGFCQRPLEPHLSVTVEIAGHKKQVCCARCAVTEANQQHKPVRLLKAHDYPTGKTIDPTKAFYVDDSRAVACTHDMTRMDESKHSDHLAFDRCSPGAFTFENKSDAEAFIRQNGGVLVSYTELMAQARYQ
jgi:nitrous oxide reductase accessory protein NosL